MDPFRVRRTVLDTTQHFIYRMTLFCWCWYAQCLEQNPLLIKKRHSKNEMLSGVQPGLCQRNMLFWFLQAWSFWFDIGVIHWWLVSILPMGFTKYKLRRLIKRKGRGWKVKTVVEFDIGRIATLGLTIGWKIGQKTFAFYQCLIYISYSSKQGCRGILQVPVYLIFLRYMQCHEISSEIMIQVGC